MVLLHILIRNTEETFLQTNASEFLEKLKEMHSRYC